MSSMFQNCKEIENIDLSNFDTSKVNDMKSMFNNCHKLKEINGMNLIIATTKNYDVSILKCLVDNVTNTLENCFVLLANVNKNNVNIVCKTNITNDKIDCGSIVKNICSKCCGNGGGNKLFAQGGGSDASNIKEYLNDLKKELKN